MTLSSGTATRHLEVYGPLQGGGTHILNVLDATARSGSARGKRLLQMLNGIGSVCRCPWTKII